MSNIITESELIRMYHSKKSNCKHRLVDFSLTLEEWISLYKLRPVLRCAYTDKAFNLRDSKSDYFPSLERCDPTRGYERGNICFIAAKVNTLKNKVMDLGMSTKGLGEDAHIVARMKKVIDNPEKLAERLKPYQEIFDKIDQRHAEEQAKETQRIERQEASDKQKKINKVKAQMDEQRALADHYSNIYDLFKNMGLQYGLSFKEHRDKLRISRSALSKVTFISLEEKYLWIPDKVTVGSKGIVEKGDFIVCFQDESELLDKLSQTGNLKTIALNALKHI
ncbi:coil containing protein [Vibrio phage 1.161.O._10N.261.48.C5]|nr:coil containing protein [Vibrio phage 1.161.O._10N.261.48.C5]